MAGKPKGRGSDKALSLRIPHDLYDRLAQVRGNGNVSEEIRQRLEASFDREQRAADPKTAKLLGAIAEMAGRVTGWQNDADQFDALAHAINLLLAGFKPAGEPKGDSSALANILIGSALGILGEFAQRVIVGTLDPEAADKLRIRLGATRKEKP
jgi:hypothetical protein